MDMLLPIIIAIAILKTGLIDWMPSTLSVALFCLFFVFGSLGLGLGYHRYFAHHAFKTSRPGVAFLGVMGAWAIQGPIVTWVADHRRHHRFSDQQYDPHSPYANDKGVIAGRFAGWLHAHIGWMLTGAASDEKRYAFDCLNDPIVMFISRHYLWIAISGLLAPGLIAWFVGGWDEALRCVLWAGCARTILIHQLAWSANSFGHMHGSKIEGSKDESRNNAFLGIVLMGEGWHSYHHEFPTLAINEPTKFDGGGHVLVFFERLGMVWDLRKAKPAPLAAAPVPIQAGSLGTGTI